MSEITNPVSSNVTAQAASGVGTAVRVLRDPAQSGRIAGAVLKSGFGFFQTLIKVLRILFLQVTGFVFLCFAIIISSGAFREYRKYSAGEVPAYKAYLAVCVAVMFLYFGLSSFYRAAKKQ